MPLLDGMLALDLSGLEGQLCGRVLRDLGMEVIKVEPPWGDPVRRMGPFVRGQPNLEHSLRFAFLNAGKKSVTIDVSRREGRGLVMRLVERVDVVLLSGHPERLEEQGLGPAAVSSRNRKAVVTVVSGFGLTGPYSHYEATDMVCFAMGGLMYISGDPTLPPVKAPETQAYYAACMYAALGTLLALWQREQDGLGQLVDVSAQEAIACQEHLIRTAAFDGVDIRRHGSQHEHVAPANIFPAQDGFVYLFVSRQHWRPFLALWEDHPRELEAPEFDQNSVRRARAGWINEVVSNFTRRFSRDELVRLMQEHGIPCLPVNRPLEFMHDEQVRLRQLFQPTVHPHLGEYQQVGSPILIDGEREPVGAPPLLGQHTQGVLIGYLGLSTQDIEMLFAQGVI